MKKVLLGTVFVTLFVSCGTSPEDKANALIEEDIKKVLYHPDTYDPVETEVDSAFTPFDDPVFYEKIVELCQLGDQVEEYKKEMKRAESSMSIWSGPYQTAYGKTQYQQAKDEYDENAENKQEAETKAMRLADELKTMFDKERQFIGFKARHRYRANNNAGQTLFGEKMYLLDKDMSRIVASYDTDSKEYRLVQTIYKEMLGEDVLTEGFDNSDE